MVLVVIQRKWPWAGSLEPRFLVLALPLGKSLFLSLEGRLRGDCGLNQVQGRSG